MVHIDQGLTPTRLVGVLLGLTQIRLPIELLHPARNVSVPTLSDDHLRTLTLQVVERHHWLVLVERRLESVIAACVVHQVVLVLPINALILSPTCSHT